MRIIFFGTPEFATYTLKSIIEAGHDVPAVVTVPDKPAGRGLKLTSSDVKNFAVSHAIPVLQPENLSDPVFIGQLYSLKPDLQIVVAFKKLPPEVFNLPPLGTLNLHASLLPQYRGAAPINHVIINGETETGVTTFLLNEKIDAGHILLSAKVKIAPEDNAGSLHDKLMTTGAVLVLETIKGLSDKTVTPVPQVLVPEITIRKAPKIFRDTCRLDFNLNAETIHNKIRGLSPYPGAFTELISPDGHEYVLKIYESAFEQGKNSAAPGSIFTDGKTFLKLHAADGLVSLLNIQLTGKGSMPVTSFLRGFQVNNSFRVKPA